MDNYSHTKHEVTMFSIQLSICSLDFTVKKHPFNPSLVKVFSVYVVQELQPPPQPPPQKKSISLLNEPRSLN